MNDSTAEGKGKADQGHGRAEDTTPKSPTCTRTVTVSNSGPLRINARDLKEYFKSVGPVECASRTVVGSARITFRESRSALEAVRRFHGNQFRGHTIAVYLEGEEMPSSNRSRGGYDRDWSSWAHVGVHGGLHGC